jgi:hypothetical protein
MRYTFFVSTGDLESGSANLSEFAVVGNYRPEHPDTLKMVATIAEVLHRGYCAKFPPAERETGQELTLVAVTAGLETEDEADDAVVGYHDGHEWEQLIDDIR